MDDVPLPGRSVDIELGGQEVITIDLDNLDPNPDDVLDLLKDGQCKVWVWTKLAGEYWRRGYLDAAERIASTAVECTCLWLAFARYLCNFFSFQEYWNDIATSTHLCPPCQPPDRTGAKGTEVGDA